MTHGPNHDCPMCRNAGRLTELAENAGINELQESILFRFAEMGWMVAAEGQAGADEAVEMLLHLANSVAIFGGLQ